MSGEIDMEAPLYTDEELARHKHLRERCRIAHAHGSVDARFIAGDIDVALDPTMTSPRMRADLFTEWEAEIDREFARLDIPGAVAP